MLTNRSPRKCILISGFVGFVYLVFLLISSANRIKYDKVISYRYDETRREGDTVMAARKPKTVTERLGEILKCSDNDFEFERLQNGEYWVLKNYIRAGHGALRCHESITYTTHGDYTFLDNLVPLVTRWQAPISLSLHAPGYDFNATLNSIMYLQKCLPESHLVAKFVTFHIYFRNDHLPSYVPQSEAEMWKTGVNCSLVAPYLKVNQSEMYKQKAKLLYPINLGRNIARKAALTHFVFASDVELYPTPGFVEQFFGMIVRNESLLQGKTPKVFPLAVFEIKSTTRIPSNKTELQHLIATKAAIPFHQRVCKSCHSIPNQTEWIEANQTDSLEVFSIAKRSGKFKYWEPFYIGTNADPIFDERVTWEGQKNKMVQCFALCLLDYDFKLLNNAFLIHSPGIKVYKPNPQRTPHIISTNKLVRKTIVPQLRALYGDRKECRIG